MKQSNEALAKQFYESFQKKEAARMIDTYHPDIVFSDPAFGTLKGDQARNMWRMLIESQQGKVFDIEFKIIQANDHEVLVDWTASYVFSKTNRSVKNFISARMHFKDGKIIRHEDHFNLYRWAGQALGLVGWLFGSFPFFKRKINLQCNQLLDRYESKQLKQPNSL